MANGFDFACDGMILGSAFLTHRPQADIPAKCQWNVHCHLHNKPPRGYRAFPHSKLFSLEYTNYSPVILAHFITDEERWRKKFLADGYTDDGVARKMREEFAASEFEELGKREGSNRET